MPNPTGYEPWMHDVVAAIYEECKATGAPLLTLWCPETADILPEGDPSRATCLGRQRFGTEEKVVPKVGKPLPQDNHRGNFRRRKIHVMYRSARCPLGIPVGAFETVRYTQNAETGDETPAVIALAYDISLPNIERLKAIAEGRNWATDEDRKLSRQLLTAAEVNARREKMDPVGTRQREAETLGVAIAKALREDRDPESVEPDENPDAAALREAALQRKRDAMAKARAARKPKAPEPVAS